MIYDGIVKRFSDGLRSLARLSLIIAPILPWLLGAPPAQARNSYWISTRDQSSCIVSAVFQYEPRFESRVRQERKIANSIILMDIHTKDPRELCNLLTLRQGQFQWRPLMCVTEVRGNIYRGHLILPEEFILDRPIEITLGDRVIEARFGP